MKCFVNFAHVPMIADTRYTTSMADDGINRDEIPEVVLVVNGTIGMSEGKAIGQAFQAAARWQHVARNSYPDHALDWICSGTRTIVKITKSKTIWERIVSEVPGFVMKDEGFTEVERDTPTIFICYPFLHKDRPKLLDNKKVKML